MGPLHACRNVFAAFVCVVVVTLPQTAPGVPGEGIDPTAEELQQIGDVPGSISWLATGESLRSALVRVLGCDQLLWLTRSAYLPTCGRPPSATSGFLKAKLSASLPLWKLAMSQWCGASRVYAWAGRGARSCTNPKWWTGVWWSPG